MISTTLVTLALIAAAPTLVSAGPTPLSLRSLPSDVSHGALDETRGMFYAYKRDGSLYGSFAVPRAEESHQHVARAGSTCVALSKEDVQKIPGWKKVEEYAKTNWGTGSYNLETNPKDYPDQPATACTEGDNVIQIDKAAMKCNSVPDSQVASGDVNGTSGELTLKFSAGTSTSMTSTVTKTSTFGAGVSISAGITIPGIAEVSAEAHTSVEFKNEIATSFESKSDNHQEQTLTVKAPQGSSCKIVFERKKCDGTGHGSISTVAGGWVWFNYNDRTKGHYKWAANLESVLADKKERSSNTDFKTQLGSNTEVNYHAKCDNGADSKAAAGNTKSKATAGPNKPADKKGAAAAPKKGAAPPPKKGAAPPPTKGAAPPPAKGATPPPKNGAAPPPKKGTAAPPKKDNTPKQKRYELDSLDV